MRKLSFSLVFIFFLFVGCSSIQLTKKVDMDNPINYIYSPNEWLVSDNEIIHKGIIKDSIIWINRPIQKNFRVTCDASIMNKTDNDLFELLFIIYGNKKIDDNNFWKDGYVVSYKNDTIKSTFVRINGIYDGTEWVMYKNINNQITQNDVIHVDISVINNYLTLLINDQTLFTELPLKKTNLGEYFGVAQFWETSNKKIKIENIQFYE